MKHLILAIKKHPCLWKVDSEEYKRVGAKRTAWSRVVQECGLSDIYTAKIMWKRLRDGLRQALKQKRMRQGLDYDTNRRWKYEKVMEFLFPYIGSETKPRYPIMDYSSNTSQLVPDNCDESDVDVKQKSNDDFVHDYDNMQSMSTEEHFPKTPEDFPKEDSPINRQNICVFSASKTFFESMSQMCEELPEHLQIKIQRSVFNTVMEAREENLKSHNSRDPLT